MNPLLSIVVPVYKEEGNLAEFMAHVVPVLEGITPDFEIVFAMDPSPDRTEELILTLRQKDARVKLIKFSRRFGQPMATLAGMQYSTGRAVIVMDVDLQDPPELIPQLVAKWKEGFDVVMAQRKNRKGETLIKKIVSAVGYKFINRIAEVPIPPNTGDFRLMNRRVVDEISRLKETHGFLRGLVALVGFRQTVVQFERPARFAGRGNYNRFLGSLRIGMNGMVSFSNYLLTLCSQMGFVIAGLSFLLGVVYAVMKLLGFPFPIGNPTIVILILFMGGIQLISVGILGEYIARIYDEVKQRPKFIIDRAVGFSSVPAGHMVPVCADLISPASEEPTRSGFPTETETTGPKQFRA
jgi:dolichol-phosphate mannosyltransferase